MSNIRYSGLHAYLHPVVFSGKTWISTWLTYLCSVACEMFGSSVFYCWICQRLRKTLVTFMQNASQATVAVNKVVVPCPGGYCN